MSDLARRRARSQGLAGPAPWLALQAQDPRATELALRARGIEPDGLVITWLMRGTLHVVRAADVGWLHGLFAPRLRAANRRRLAQLGVEDAAALVARIEGALPATRAELAALVGTAGERAGARARAHQGRDRGRADALARPRLHPVRRRPVDDPLAELGRRYGECHADATPADLAYWSGLPLREARAAFVAGECEDGPVPLRLLGAFDELLLGWKDRTPIVPAAHARAVHPGGGILRPLVLEDGEARGTWSQPGGVVKLDLWRRVMDTAALEAEVAAISR